MFELDPQQSPNLSYMNLTEDEEEKEEKEEQFDQIEDSYVLRCLKRAFSWSCWYGQIDNQP